MVNKVIKIETPGGEYTLLSPTGKIGATHMAIVLQASPMRKPVEGYISEADRDRNIKAFEQWSAKVLPAIYVDGPVKYDEMSGEDQYALYSAMLRMVSFKNGQLFRIIE